MAAASLSNLAWMNFLVADMQTGFGPFVSVDLTVAGWDTGRIGVALGAASIAALAAQVPAGMLVDTTSDKRRVAGGAILTIVLALLLLAAAPGFATVLLAEIVQGGAGSVLALAIAAITLALSNQNALGERLGQNVRFAAIGSAAGAGVLGLVGSGFGPAAVFVLAAGCGLVALVALRNIHRADLHAAPLRTGHHTAPPPARRRGPPRHPMHLITDRRLWLFMACLACFQLGNAALLPLAVAGVTRHGGGGASLVTAAAVIVPQLLVAGLSPWVGRMAQSHGRHAILLIGFAAMPLRALLLSLGGGSAGLLVFAQAFDGISGAVLGVLTPLIVADLTHSGGRFNVSLGLIGVAVGIGAASGNFIAGTIAESAGLPIAFLALAAAGIAGTCLVWLAMPETADLPNAHPAPLAAKRAPPLAAAAPAPTF